MIRLNTEDLRMTYMNLIGYILLSLPFVLIFLGIAEKDGMSVALAVFVATAAAVGYLHIVVKLIS